VRQQGVASAQRLVMPRVLDARLALAKTEMKSGQIIAGRAHLTAIEAYAKAKGYNLIARKAASAGG